MIKQQNNILRPATVTLIGRIIAPLTESGLITCSEYSAVITNLKHLAKHGELKPAVTPKLITPQEAAALLAIGYSSFRALEAAGEFPFKRKMIGKSVRYRNIDILDYIEADSDTSQEGGSYTSDQPSEP